MTAVRPALDTRTTEAADLVTAGRLDEAEALLDGCVGYRAALERARIGYRRNLWVEAHYDATTAATGAAIAGDALAEGRALQIAAVAECQLDGYDPGPTFARSLRRLEAAGDPVALACCENDNGHYLLGLDRPDEARAFYERARDGAAEAGDEDRALTFTASLAFALYAEGRYTDTITRAEWIAGRAATGEALEPALRIRALALLAEGRTREARTAARAYTATLSAGSGWDAVAAPLILARADGALDRFPALVAAAEAIDGRQHAAIARLWWWATLYDADPVEACLRYAELYAPAASDGHVFAKIERRAVDYRTLQPSPLSLLDPDRFPHRPTAEARLDAALLLAAYRHTGGNSTRMARMLGLARSAVSVKMRALGLEPLATGRPRKS